MRVTSSSTTTAGPTASGTACATGDELLARVVALPGFGKAKARIFVGLLGKRLGVRPPGWEAVAADWPSIADVDTFERVAEIREKKRAMKAAKKPRPKPDAADERRRAEARSRRAFDSSRLLGDGSVLVVVHRSPRACSV